MLVSVSFHFILFCFSLFFFFFCTVTVSKKEFENKYLGTPTIEVVDDANVAVSLRCKADRLHGLEKWNNVTYKFQWFREGSLTKDQLRSASDDLGTYRPTEKYIDSLLNGGLGLDEYTPGVWVRNIWHNRNKIITCLQCKERK